jgi:hypothetical protein
MNLERKTAMPRIAKVGKSEVYAAHLEQRHEMRERGDCAVRAVAALTDTPYEKVHAMMAAQGRKHGKGTPLDIIWSTLNALGFKAERRWDSEFIRQYPGSHATALKSVTTHHPDRFPAVWKDGRRYLMSTPRHVLAIVDGVNHDWTRGKACRSKGIWEITRVTPAQAEREMMIRYEM